MKDPVGDEIVLFGCQNDGEQFLFKQEGYDSASDGYNRYLQQVNS